MPVSAPYRRRRAAALLLVLAMLAMLAFIVTEIVASATQRLAWEAQSAQHDVLRQEAFSGLEATLGVLAMFQRLDGALYGPAQGWSNPLGMTGFSAGNGVTIDVTVRDESGYYGLSAMDGFTLRRYFQDLGFSMDQGQRLADCLLDWTDEGDNTRLNGAERESYPEGIAPPNRPLQSLEEMRYILGFQEVFFNEDGTGNELWKKLAGSVSLLSNSSQPNINTAPQSVLELLATRYAFDPQGLLEARDGSGNIGGNTTVYRNASDLGRAGIPAALGDAVSFSCTRLRIITRATKGDVSVVVDTLLNTSGGGAGSSQYPFTIIQQRVNALLQE